MCIWKGEEKKREGEGEGTKADGRAIVAGGIHTTDLLAVLPDDVVSRRRDDVSNLLVLIKKSHKAQTRLRATTSRPSARYIITIIHRATARKPREREIERRAALHPS